MRHRSDCRGRNRNNCCICICICIIFSSCGFFFFLFFFLAYSQWLQIGCIPYFHTWCGLSANLECRSEMCCKWLADNTGCKKSPKIRHLGTITQLCQAVSSQLRHVLTIRKKLVKQQYLLHVPNNVAIFGPLVAEIIWLVWGTLANFNGFCVLVALLHDI